MSPLPVPTHLKTILLVEVVSISSPMYIRFRLLCKPELIMGKFIWGIMIFVILLASAYHGNYFYSVPPLPKLILQYFSLLI